MRTYRLPLKELLAKYSPTYYESWDEWFNTEEIETLDLINDLIEELKKNGSFETPVILCSDEDGYTIGDGMHRIFAHHLSGVDMVLVQDYWNIDSDGSADHAVLEAVFSDVRIWKNDENMELFLEGLSWRHHGSKHSPWLSSEVTTGDAIITVFLIGGTRNLTVPWEVLQDLYSRVRNYAIPLSVEWAEEGE